MPLIDVVSLEFGLAYTLLMVNQAKVVVEHLRAISLLKNGSSRTKLNYYIVTPLISRVNLNYLMTV